MTNNQQAVALVNATGLLAGLFAAAKNGGTSSFTITDVIHSNEASLFGVALFFAMSCTITEFVTQSKAVWTIALSLSAVAFNRKGLTHDAAAAVGFVAMILVGSELGLSFDRAILVGVPIAIGVLWTTHALGLGHAACLEYSLFALVNASLL